MTTKRKILIVEDNLDNLSIYTTVLEFMGYEVQSAKDGATGLTMASELMPDLILMDVAMPGVDGWEATQRLKADPATQRIPIIVLTAHALESHRAKAFDSGADGYVAKPADPMTVVRAIRKLLGESTEGPLPAEQRPTL
jgi:CheY-like chemotaxis protein